MLDPQVINADELKKNPEFQAMFGERQGRIYDAPADGLERMDRDARDNANTRINGEAMTRERFQQFIQDKRLTSICKTFSQESLAIQAATKSEVHIPTTSATQSPRLTTSPTRRHQHKRTSSKELPPAGKYSLAQHLYIANRHQRRCGQFSLKVTYIGFNMRDTENPEPLNYLQGKIEYRGDFINGNFMFQTLSATPSLKPFMTGNKNLDVSKLIAGQQANIAQLCRTAIQETEKALQQFPDQDIQAALDELKKTENADQKLRQLYQLNDRLSKQVEQQFDKLYSDLKGDVERSHNADQPMAQVLESAKQFRQELSPQLPAVVHELEKLRWISLLAGGTPPEPLVATARFNLAKMAVQDEIAAAKALYQCQPEKYPTLPIMVQAAESELEKQPNTAQRLEGIALCLSVSDNPKTSLTPADMFDQYTQLIIAKEELKAIHFASDPLQQSAIDALLKSIEENPLTHDNVTDWCIRLHEMKYRIEQKKEIIQESPFLAARTDLESFAQENPKFKKIIRIAISELNECAEENPASIPMLTQRLSETNQACHNAQLTDRSASMIDPKVVLKQLISAVRTRRFEAASEKLQTTITVTKEQAASPLLAHAQKVLTEANRIAKEHPKDKKLLTSTLNSLNALIKAPANPANQQRYEQQRQQTLKRSQHRPWLKKIAGVMSLITGGALIAAGILGSVFTHGISLLLAGAGLAMMSASLGAMQREKPNPDLNTPVTKILAQRARTQAPPFPPRSTIPAEVKTVQSASMARPRMGGA